MASVYTTYFTKQWEETIFEGVILFLSTNVLRIFKWQIHLVCTKGKIISECPLEILDFPKIPQKFDRFLP